MCLPRVFTLCVLLLSLLQSADGSEIIGGKEVEAHSLPHMALLRNKTGLCGGTLIDAKWVLSAAHCFGFKEVLLGVHDINKEEKKSWQKVAVKHSFPYPCFDKSEGVHDLMLLELKNKVKQTNTVRWLKLNKRVQDPKAGSVCVVAGWGTTSNKKPKMSNVLMSANVTVIDRFKCNSHQHYNMTPVITNSMICASSDGKNPTDTCAGDSGGPLLCNGALVGITSFGGLKCGNIKNPGVYTFLSEKHLNWMWKIMKKREML